MTIDLPRRFAALAMHACAAGILVVALNAPARAETRAPFQEYDYRESCGTNSICTIDFHAVPKSTRLEISNVSCHAALVGSGADAATLEIIQLLVVRPNDVVYSASTLVPAIIGQGATFRTFAANHTVRVYATQNQHFQVYLRQAASSHNWNFVACHISGDMVTLP